VKLANVAAATVASTMVGENATNVTSQQDDAPGVNVVGGGTVMGSVVGCHWWVSHYSHGNHPG
jgi:hypothetical protein